MAGTPTAEQGKAQAQTGLVYLARAGYAARAVVYLIVGVMAILAAWGQSQTRGTRGALSKLLSEPFGQVLLGVVAAGLLGYAVWRFCQAIFDTDGHGKGAKGLALRLGFIGSSLANLGLTVVAVTMIFGSSGGSGASGGGGGGGGSKSSDWTARLMQWPAGRWIVGAVALIIIGVGIGQIVKAASGKFKDMLKVGPGKMTWVSPISRVGLIARGITFALIGLFLGIAAWQFDPSKARGLSGTLATLERQPFGPWLITAAGLGLIAFAGYCLILALWRRINPPGR